MNIRGAAVKWYVLKTEKPSKYKDLPGDRGQLDVESEDKNSASYNWSIRNY